MRVAILLDVFPSASQTFIATQIAGLLDLGHEVDIVASSRPQQDSLLQPDLTGYALLERTRYVDIPEESGYWELPVWPLTGRTWPPGSASSIPNGLRVLRAAPVFLRCLTRAPRLAVETLRPSRWGYQARSLSALYRLSALCGWEACYDVVHAHFGFIGSSFRFVRELWNAPLVVSFHGYDFSGWPREHGADCYERLFATADAVTVNSEFTRGRLESLGCPPQKIHKIPAPARIEDFVFRVRRLEAGVSVRLLTVGRLVEKKGIEYVIRAVARVRAAHPAIRYDVIGDGPQRERLTELAHSLGLEGVVTFHGARDQGFVREKMDEAHLFVLASVTAEGGDTEGQGVALLEAQASGLPVVATDHNGFPESIAPGRSGFLVPERDVEALASRIVDLIHRSDAWPEMGRAGRDHVETHYELGRLNRQLAALYERLAAEHRARHA